jgi:hypothetical protein
MTTKTTTEALPLSIGREQEVHEFMRGQREALRVLDLGGAADTALAVAIRETLDRLGATLAASRQARQAEEAERRREEDQRRADQARQEQERKELQERAATWLQSRLAGGAVRRSDLEEEAEEAGLGGVLPVAARELGVHEIDGKYLTGTAGPDVGVAFLTLTARPGVGVTKPAA